MVGACGSDEGTDVEAGQETAPAADPPPPEPEPALVEAQPTAVRAGEIIELRFPTQVVRGVPWYLSRWNADSWDEPTFLVIADAGQEGVDAPEWIRLDGDNERWDDIGAGGPGPDLIVAPPSAEPGWYRACTANTGDVSYCVQFEILSEDT